jgi:hypothetical protein
MLLLFCFAAAAGGQVSAEARAAERQQLGITTSIS